MSLFDWYPRRWYSYSLQAAHDLIDALIEKLSGHEAELRELRERVGKLECKD